MDFLKLYDKGVQLGVLKKLKNKSASINMENKSVDKFRKYCEKHVLKTSLKELEAIYAFKINMTLVN